MMKEARMYLNFNLRNVCGFMFLEKDELTCPGFTIRTTTTKRGYNFHFPIIFCLFLFKASNPSLEG